MSKPKPYPRYWIECDLTPFGPANCSVVDFHQPIGDGDGKGFVALFSGSFEECDAWLESHPQSANERRLDRV